MTQQMCTAAISLPLTITYYLPLLSLSVSVIVFKEQQQWKAADLANSNLCFDDGKLVNEKGNYSVKNILK